jgi:TolA-binding protein
MKHTRTKHVFTTALRIAICTAAIALVPGVRGAEVSEEDFKALKEEVRKLTEKMDRMEKVHQTDEQIKQKDQDQIKQLQQKLGETQTTATEAARKADAATQAQPIYRVPDDSGSVNKNFMILGDAEVQYAKFPGEHGTFLFADFAPIFLYRAGDRILFEAGFDTTLQNGSNPVNGHDSGTTSSFDMSFAQ